MDTTIRNLDETAYRRLKARAAVEGRTLGEAVSEAIRRYVAEPPPGGDEPGRRAAVEIGERPAAYGAARRPAGSPESRRRALERLLAEEIWPRVPEELLDRTLDKREREAILGYGSGGV